MYNKQNKPSKSKGKKSASVPKGKKSASVPKGKKKARKTSGQKTQIRQLFEKPRYAGHSNKMSI